MVRRHHVWRERWAKTLHINQPTQMNAGVVVALIIGLCASLSTVVLVQGGSFSSNVVMLNSRNWRKEVEDSGHAIFINVW